MPDDLEGEAGQAPTEEPPRLPLRVRAWRSAKGWGFSLSTVLLAILLAEVLRRPLAPLSAALAAHFGAVRDGLIVAVAAGGTLFVASYVYMMRHGVSLDPADFDRMLERSRRAGGDASGWRRGERPARRRGGSFDFEIRFRQVKEVLRLDGWWRDPLWASVIAAMAGGLILVFGGFGFLVLYGPGWIKVLFGGWALYALGMTVRGFSRA
jgi:hypothetical protein